MKIISFMHVSLDGFVAGPNGEINWVKANEEIQAIKTIKFLQNEDDYIYN